MTIINKDYETTLEEIIKDEVWAGEYKSIDDLISLNEGIIEFTKEELLLLEDEIYKYEDYMEEQAEQERWEREEANREQAELEQHLNWWINYGVA